MAPHDPASHALVPERRLVSGLWTSAVIGGGLACVPAMLAQRHARALSMLELTATLTSLCVAGVAVMLANAARVVPTHPAQRDARPRRVASLVRRVVAIAHVVWWVIFGALVLASRSEDVGFLAAAWHVLSGWAALTASPLILLWLVVRQHRRDVQWQCALQDVAQRLEGTITHGGRALRRWFETHGCVGPGGPEALLWIRPLPFDHYGPPDDPWHRYGRASVIASRICGYDLAIDACEETGGHNPSVWLATLVDEDARARVFAAPSIATLQHAGFQLCVIPLGLAARAFPRGRCMLERPQAFMGIVAVAHALAAIAREAGLPTIGSIAAR